MTNERDPNGIYYDPQRDPQAALVRERNYQLLQAAAVLGSTCPERFMVNNGYLHHPSVVDEALALLTEIESRVK